MIGFAVGHRRAGFAKLEQRHQRDQQKLQKRDIGEA
jgi:hypothetical protein